MLSDCAGLPEHGFWDGGKEEDRDDAGLRTHVKTGLPCEDMDHFYDIPKQMVGEWIGAVFLWVTQLFHTQVERKKIK